MIGKLYVIAYKEQYTLVDYSSLGLLTCKFTITHPIVVVVITVIHVHVPLSRLESIMLQNLPIVLFGISVIFCLYIMLVLCFLDMNYADISYF